MIHNISINQHLRGEDRKHSVGTSLIGNDPKFGLLIFPFNKEIDDSMISYMEEKAKRIMEKFNFKDNYKENYFIAMVPKREDEDCRLLSLRALINKNCVGTLVETKSYDSSCRTDLRVLAKNWKTFLNICKEKHISYQYCDFGVAMVVSKKGK